MVTWMAYAAGVGGLVAAGAFSLEKICEQTGWPRRFAWLAGLTLALVVPFSASPEAGGGSAAVMAEAIPAAPGTAPRGSVGPLLADAAGDPGIPGEAIAAAGGTAERAALALWGLASLAALVVICAVMVAAVLARRRWGRHRIAGEDVYVSRRFGPALVGVTRPAIVIPRWVVRLGDAVGATVVRHEREHARAWDHLALLYAGLVVAIMPWSPAVWWMFLRLRTAVEIDCDRRVLASGVTPAEYGDLLLDIGSGRPARTFFALAMASSGSMLERRLKAMRIQRNRVHRSVQALFGCAAVAAIVIACEMPAPAGIAPAVNDALAEPEEADVEAVVAAPTPAEAQAGRPATDASAPQAATDEQGRVLIQGVRPSPSLSLAADAVARDPLVFVDNELREGGLAALLAAEPLDIEGIGYSRDQRLFSELGEAVTERGIVIIRTVGGPAWDFGNEAELDSWQDMADEWQAAQREAAENVQAILEQQLEAREAVRKALEMRPPVALQQELVERLREAALRQVEAVQRLIGEFQDSRPLQEQRRKTQSEDLKRTIENAKRQLEAVLERMRETGEFLRQDTGSDLAQARQRVAEERQLAAAALLEAATDRERATAERQRAGIERERAAANRGKATGEEEKAAAELERTALLRELVALDREQEARFREVLATARKAAATALEQALADLERAAADLAKAAAALRDTARRGEPGR